MRERREAIAAREPAAEPHPKAAPQPEANGEIAGGDADVDRQARREARLRNGTRLRDLQTLHPDASREKHDAFVLWFAVRCCAVYFLFRILALIYTMWEDGSLRDLHLW